MTGLSGHLPEQFTGLVVGGAGFINKVVRLFLRLAILREEAHKVQTQTKAAQQSCASKAGRSPVRATQWMVELAEKLHAIVQQKVGPLDSGFYRVSESNEFQGERGTFVLPELHVKAETVFARTESGEPLRRASYEAKITMGGSACRHAVETDSVVQMVAIQLNPEKSSRRDASTDDTMIYIRLSKGGQVVPGWDKARALRKKDAPIERLF